MTPARNYGLGALFLALGLGGHLASAHEIDMLPHAFRDHIAGFIILTAGAAVILLVLERFFWRGRRDITVLVLGIVQLVLGAAIFWWTISKVIVYGAAIAGART